jgi:hypothetical protein
VIRGLFNGFFFQLKKLCDVTWKGKLTINCFFNPSGLFLSDLPVLRISPAWVTSPELVKSSGRVATFNPWTGVFWDGVSFIPGKTVIPM